MLISVTALKPEVFSKNNIMIYTADKYIHRSEHFSIWAYSDVSAEDFDIDITIFFENKTYVCTMYAARNLYSHFEKNPEESFFLGSIVPYFT